jgi:surface antigen
MLRLLSCVALVFTLGACASGHHDDTNAVIGATAGAVMGALVDHGTTAPFANVGAINKRLNDEDRRRLQDAEDRAYRGPLGETVTWRNDLNGHSGSITAKSEHKRATGDLCREFELQVLLGAHNETGYGIACQAADGSWKVVS